MADGWWKSERLWVALAGGAALALVAGFVLVGLKAEPSVVRFGAAAGFVIGASVEALFWGSHAGFGYIAILLGVVCLTIVLYFTTLREGRVEMEREAARAQGRAAATQPATTAAPQRRRR